MVMGQTDRVSFWTEAKNETFYFPAESQSYAKRRAARKRRRTQRLIATAMVVLAALLGFFVGRAQAGDSRKPAPTKVTWITVGEGDSLWSVASHYGDRELSVRERIVALEKANPRAARGGLFPGQKLRLP